MDIIGFLYASLSSSTVQLHGSLGSRCSCACAEAGFSSQNGDRAWGVYYQRAAFFNVKDSHKEMFPVYGGKCLSCKMVHNWFEKFPQGRLKVADDAWQGVEMAETTIKRLLCCRFRHTVKVMGQVYQCWWRMCQEINVFSRFEYQMFSFYSHLWPIYWLWLVLLAGFTDELHVLVAGH
jgi:hypothetical protein